MFPTFEECAVFMLGVNFLFNKFGFSKEFFIPSETLKSIVFWISLKLRGFGNCSFGQFEVNNPRNNPFLEHESAADQCAPN